MTDYAHLWLFFVFVLGIMLLPGLDMAYILGSALAGGRRSGYLALAGVAAGGTCHVIAGVLGISVLLKLYPAAFRFMLLAGAVYIAWIGFSILRSASAFHLHPEGRKRGPWATFRQGMVTCLLNPKAYLFMLAVFPQFLRPEYGALWMQGVVMWLIILLGMAGVYGPLAYGAGGFRNWLEKNPASAVNVSRGVGLMLMAVAVFTAVDGWRGV
ncbi:MAG TPA: LysE family translocator [Gammaproteobacteria bacterium]|jgi:threonine/homoserine/homoserine lactone efflux protein